MESLTKDALNGTSQPVAEFSTRQKASPGSVKVTVPKPSLADGSTWPIPVIANCGVTGCNGPFPSTKAWVLPRLPCLLPTKMQCPSIWALLSFQPQLANNRSFYRPAKINPAALQANMTVGAWVLAEVMLGNTDASTTRKPCTPCTRRLASTTPPWASGAMRQLPQGW